jgi:hypothetical protein
MRVRSHRLVSGLLACTGLATIGCVGGWKVSCLEPATLIDQQKPPVVQVVHRLNDGQQVRKVTLWYPVIVPDSLLGFAYQPQRRPEHAPGKPYGTDAIPISSVVSVATDRVNVAATLFLFVGIIGACVGLAAAGNWGY